MAMAMLVVKVMPDNVEVDLAKLKEDVEKTITEIYGDVGEIRTEEEPIAFGLKALNFTFIMDEIDDTYRKKLQEAGVGDLLIGCFSLT